MRNIVVVSVVIVFALYSLCPVVSGTPQKLSAIEVAQKHEMERHKFQQKFNTLLCQSAIDVAEIRIEIRLLLQEKLKLYGYCLAVPSIGLAPFVITSAAGIATTQLAGASTRYLAYMYRISSSSVVRANAKLLAGSTKAMQAFVAAEKTRATMIAAIGLSLTASTTYLEILRNNGAVELAKEYELTCKGIRFLHAQRKKLEDTRHDNNMADANVGVSDIASSQAIQIDKAVFATVDSVFDKSDVYKFTVAPAKKKVIIQLFGPGGGAGFNFNADIYLYGPSANNLTANPVAQATGGTATETLQYVLPGGARGTYYVEVRAVKGGRFDYDITVLVK